MLRFFFSGSHFELPSRRGSVRDGFEDISFVVYRTHDRLFVYSFVVAVSAKHTRNKVLLVLFAVLFPAASGFILYYFRGSREDKVVTDTPNS